MNFTEDLNFEESVILEMPRAEMYGLNQEVLTYITNIDRGTVRRVAVKLSSIVSLVMTEIISETNLLIIDVIEMLIIVL